MSGLESRGLGSGPTAVQSNLSVGFKAEFLFRGFIATKSLIKVTVCEQIGVKPLPLGQEVEMCTGLFEATSSQFVNSPLRNTRDPGPRRVWWERKKSSNKTSC